MDKYIPAPIARRFAKQMFLTGSVLGWAIGFLCGAFT